jgi:16S rRNA (guanine966-N2)-methyltransferase
MERTQIRIVAGSHRGRKLTVEVHKGMRPTPLMVREALFSILGHAVPGKPFFDIFAGTGVNGLEAISRGATKAVFVERDVKLATAIERQLEEFTMTRQAQVLRGDVYRWAERWLAPTDAVNVFLSPPFPDLTERAGEFLELVQTLAGKLPIGSVLILQLEDGFSLEMLPDFDRWDVRHYGRNILAFWEPEEKSDETQLDSESE